MFFGLRPSSGLFLDALVLTYPDGSIVKQYFQTCASSRLARRELRAFFFCSFIFTKDEFDFSHLNA